MANVAKSSPFKSCSYVDIANKGYSVAMLVKGMQSHREIKFILTPKEVKMLKINQSQRQEKNWICI